MASAPEVARLGDLGLRVEIPDGVDRLALRERFAALPFVHDAVVTESHAAVYVDEWPGGAEIFSKISGDRLRRAVNRRFVGRRARVKSGKFCCDRAQTLRINRIVTQ